MSQAAEKTVTFGEENLLWFIFIVLLPKQKAYRY